MFTYERIQQRTNGFVHMRLWIQDDGQEADRFTQIADHAQEILIWSLKEDLREAAESIMNNLRMINAIELKTKQGNGVVLYRDWP
jgi:peptide subunit release factor 1 (eRF1)